MIFTKDNGSRSKEEKKRFFFLSINDTEYTFDVNDTLGYTVFFVNN